MRGWQRRSSLAAGFCPGDRGGHTVECEFRLRCPGGRRDRLDPAVSPLYADLSGLPPVYTFQGDHDLFLPDVTLLNRRINQGGGHSTFTVAEGGFHVYVGAPWPTWCSSATPN
jgi:acetyl esterase/lipase